MGLNFRKRIKIAPGVNLNIGKKSIGVSAGVKGARVSVNSSGRKTATVGVPGTGVYYTKSSGSSKNTSKASDTGNTAGSAGNPKRNKGKGKWYTRTGWIIALTIFFFPVGLFLMWKYKKNWNTGLKGVITAGILGIGVLGFGGNDPVEPPTPTTIQSEVLPDEEVEQEENNEIVDDQTSGQTETEKPESELVSPEESVESESQETIEEPEPTVEQPVESGTEEISPVVETPVSDSEPVAPQSEPEMVWVNGTAGKYHIAQGSHGMKNAYQVTIDEAIAMGKSVAEVVTKILI